MTTTDRGISKIGGESFSKETNCKTIPRVYGGVTYDACSTFLGKTSAHASYQEWKVIPYFLDSLVCLASDTVILPYSIYMQSKHGSISVGDQDIANK